MEPTKLARAINYLTRLVPAPRREPPRVQDSWANLKVGQRLSNLQSITIGTTKLPIDTLWEVVYTTNQGASLTAIANPVVKLTLTQRDWKGLFKRTRSAVKRTRQTGGT